MTNTIDNTEDFIDSRDIIERIEELESELQDLESEIDDTNVEIDQAKQELEDWKESNLEELETLKSLAEESSCFAPDWEYGATLIRESYFTEYCEDLCKDIGDIPSELPWYISNHIDWDGVAREIKMDYTEVDFDGVAYFIR